MAKKCNLALELPIIFLACLIIPSNCSDRLPTNGKSRALFIFGDSLFDAGNNNFINTTTDFQANFKPYGETFFKIPTGRFSDGRLIPDFIAEYAKLPLIPPFLDAGHHKLTYGLNFASGGAGALVEVYPGLVINLHMQLRNFEKIERRLSENLGKDEAKELVANAVYLFTVGANDYFFRIFANSSVFEGYSPEEYANLVTGNVTQVIRGIYEKGGRKFGIMKQGPLGCVPIFRALLNGTCQEEVNTFARLHNELLDKKLKHLEKELKGFRYSLFDLYTSFSDIQNNPSKYGFEDVIGACCGSGPYRGLPSCSGKRQIKEYELCDNVSDYLFFDDSHPTEAGNRKLAELMWDGPPNLTGAYNLNSLFRLTIS